MFQIKVNSELIIIEEITLAEPTVGMDKNNVPVLVDVSSFQMPVQLPLSVKLLLF